MFILSYLNRLYLLKQNKKSSMIYLSIQKSKLTENRNMEFFLGDFASKRCVNINFYYLSNLLMLFCNFDVN